MPNHNEAKRGQIVDNGLDPNENVLFCVCVLHHIMSDQHHPEN